MGDVGRREEERESGIESIESQPRVIQDKLQQCVDTRDHLHARLFGDISLALISK